ncbi:hypothetical protein GmHk_01G001128 [Glycine max]|nr:hypothetical protein GmHk_01G001128 [Glycine max]
MNNYFSSIEILNESNYCNWKQDLKFSLGISDLDLALRERTLAKWERSDRLSFIAIKSIVSKHLLSGLLEKATTKEFLGALGERCLMKQLMDMRYDNVGGVREFIMKMLKSHQVNLNKKFIVKHALISLPTDYTQIKISHNTVGEKWIVNDLITKCVVEEEKLKNEKGKSISCKGHGKTAKSASIASHRYQGSRKWGKGQHHCNTLNESHRNKRDLEDV